MDDKFDELSKALAGGISRRSALRVMAAGVAGSVLALLGVRDSAASDDRTNPYRNDQGSSSTPQTPTLPSPTDPDHLEHECEVWCSNNRRQCLDACKEACHEGYAPCNCQLASGSYICV